MTEQINAKLTDIQERRRRQALTAITLIVIGLCMVAAAVWMLFSPWYAVLALGAVALVLGVLIGLNN
jgi:uncharacterized membrane protein